MELILKKTKINNSILNQLEAADYGELRTYDVMGWCMHKDRKVVILYNQYSGQIRKSRFVKETCPEIYNGKWRVIITLDTDEKILWEPRSEKETDQILDTYNRIKVESELKGQFFI